MMTLTEAIGFGVAVAGVLGFLCTLLWYGGRSRGVETGPLLVAGAKVVGSICLAIAIGLIGRSLVGGPAIDIGAHTGRFLGVWVAPLQAHQTVTIAVCLLLMALLFIYAQLVMRSVTQGPVIFGSGDEDGEGFSGGQDPDANSDSGGPSGGAEE